MPLLLLAFVVVPLVELLVIGEVAAWLGWPATIVVLFLDSLAGAVLVRREGRRAWDAFRDALASLRWPADEVMQGALVLVGGALLVTPGFVTDVAGLAMVVPVTRAILSEVLRSRFRPASFEFLGGSGRDRTGTRSAGRPGPQHGHRRSRPEDEPVVLDVEVLSIEPEEEREDGDHGDVRP